MKSNIPTDLKFNRKTIYSFKQLLVLFNRNPINTRTKVGKIEKQQFIAEVQQYYELKIDSKNDRYVFMPNNTKKQLKNQERRDNKQLVYIPEEQQEVTINDDNHIYRDIKLDDLLIQFVLSFQGQFFTKNELMILFYHSWDLYYKLYYHYYSVDQSDSYNSFIKQYPLEDIINAEKFINEVLYSTIFKRLDKLAKKGVLDIEVDYLTNYNQIISATELANVIHQACAKYNCTSEDQIPEDSQQDYYNTRNEILQEFIEKNIDNFGTLNKYDTIKINKKGLRVYKGPNYKSAQAQELTKDTQAQILYKFVGRLRERLRYRINIGKKKVTSSRSQRLRDLKKINVNHTVEIKFFNMFEPYLYMSVEHYHSFDEFVNGRLWDDYNTNIISNFKNKSEEEIEEIIRRTYWYRKHLQDVDKNEDW